VKRDSNIYTHLVRVIWINFETPYTKNRSSDNKISHLETGLSLEHTSSFTFIRSGLLSTVDFTEGWRGGFPTSWLTTHRGLCETSLQFPPLRFIPPAPRWLAPSPSYRNGTRVIVSPLIALPFCRLFANCSNNSCALAIHAQPPLSPILFSALLPLCVLVALVSLNQEIRAEWAKLMLK